jgi:hypothetical protein
MMDVNDNDEYPIGYICNFTCFKGRYRPIRPIQYHVAIHESVTAEPIQEVAEYYQPLFNLLHQEHNVIATQTELDEIIRTAESLRNAVPDPYMPDWSKAPEGTVAHAFDESKVGIWYIVSPEDDEFVKLHELSNLTLPADLDWKQSLRVKPN